MTDLPDPGSVRVAVRGPGDCTYTINHHDWSESPPLSVSV